MFEGLVFFIESSYTIIRGQNYMQKFFTFLYDFLYVIIMKTFVYLSSQSVALQLS
jgi:hypothetical protein